MQNRGQQEQQRVQEQRLEPQAQTRKRQGLQRATAPSKPPKQETSKLLNVSSQKRLVQNPRVNSTAFNELLLIVANQKPFRAGALSRNIVSWQPLTSDCFILDTVQGFKFEFIRPPLQNALRKQLLISSQEINIAQNLLQELLEKLVVEKTTQFDRSGFVSNIFLRPKRTGGHRLILNLKPLNKFVEYVYFKMATFATALKLVTRGCFFS